MFNKSRLLATLALSASTAAAVFAQQIPPAPPVAPAAPNLERAFQVFTTGDGGYLGVYTQDVTRENFNKFNLRDVRGVAVERVEANSPAAQAGLQANDVIVRFNGEDVTSVRKFQRLVSEVAPDHQVKITVLRGGNDRELTATLGKRPGFQVQTGSFGNGEFRTTIPALPRMPRMDVAPQVFSFPGGEGGNFTVFTGRQIGVGVTQLTPQLGSYFGVGSGKGVLVSNVRENSAAAKAGLRAGDVITEVNGKTVANTIELTRAINEKQEGDVTLTIVRDRNRQTVKVTPEKGQNSDLQMEFFRNGENGRTLRRLSPSRVPPAPSRIAPLNRTRPISRVTIL